ncbi:hypothetical protein evm_004203 [Chilo suppressalis]|nr:hypothetical protein evm_004203 [Chilo suppressalis]
MVTKNLLLASSSCFGRHVLKAVGPRLHLQSLATRQICHCEPASRGAGHGPISLFHPIGKANSIIPPPYSCASNYEECSGVGCGRSLLRSLSSLTERAPAPASASAPSPAAAPAPAPATAHAPAVAHHVVRPRKRAASESTNNGRTRESSQTFRDNLITSPVQDFDPTFDLELELIDCEMYCDGGCKPRLGASPPAHRSPSTLEEGAYDHEAYGLRHLFSCPSPDGPNACESPPQPTSPTQTSRESTLRRPSDERRHRRLETVKKTPKVRKSSLYMPLVAYPTRTTRISPGTRASSRSAPATPCSGLVPNLVTFTQRVSASRHGSRSSRLEEESNPLLAEAESSRADHKF